MADPDDERAAPVAPFPADRLIVVRGIMQRSGTNFVGDLFQLHPDVGTHTGLYEDHLFGAVDVLERYVALTIESWRPEWTIDRDLEATRLREGLGVGLASYLAAGVDAPFVMTKMPSMDGLADAIDLLPTSGHVVVIRDGRAVVESATRSFDEPFDREARRWADGARQVLAAKERHGDRLLVVRYEDLLADLESVWPTVLDHVGLPVDRFPMATALDLPVRGSSELAGTAEGVHWSPVERSAVDPSARASDWTDDQRARFDHIAGAELEALGYARDTDLPAVRTVPTVDRARWELRRRAGRARRWLRSRL